MSHIDQWFSEQPHRSPAEIACLLARDRFWNDEHLRLIGTHPEWPDAAWLLDLSEELAHTLILVLSRLPEVLRRDFADRFYAERVSHATEHPLDERARLAFGATAVVNVVDLFDEAVCGERTLDLLRGAAQGDDLTRTPGPAVDELRKTIARVRFDVGFDTATPQLISDFVRGAL